MLEGFLDVGVLDNFNSFIFRSKDVEWVNFLTTRFVDDITNHLKIYRKTKQRLEKGTCKCKNQY